MGCNCNKSRKVKTVNSATQEISATESSNSIREALEINLKQCYECAKKHVSRAKEEFKEYHTGYPQHIKNLMMSLKVAENDVRQAFLKWCEVQAQLDMGAGELLGNGESATLTKQSHVALANAIRKERLQLNENPLYIPDFDELLVQIQLLEFAD